VGRSPSCLLSVFGTCVCAPRPAERFGKKPLRSRSADMPTAFLKRLFKPQTSPAYAVPEGLCVYAIGDVHGCLDQLNHLLDVIDRDVGSRAAQSHIIFLGDLVDRGPKSAEVIGRIVGSGLPADSYDFIMGNHEEVMLNCYEGQVETYGRWLQYGGVQTLESYGLKDTMFSPSFDLAAAMRNVIPAGHISFLRSFKDYVRLGDYIFAHAGIRPGVPLDEQSRRDLRWIREGFLDDRTDHGFRVVHGHTIVHDVEVHRNRIAVDTGCYLTGQLSAVALESDTVRVLTVRA
jgi:serine/threonine protein phosphatase 1